MSRTSRHRDASHLRGILHLDLTCGGLMTRAEGVHFGQGHLRLPVYFFRHAVSTYASFGARRNVNPQSDLHPSTARTSARGCQGGDRPWVQGKRNASRELRNKTANSAQELDKLISTMLTVSMRSRGGSALIRPSVYQTAHPPKISPSPFQNRRRRQAQLPRSAKSARLTTSSMPFASSWGAA